MVNLQSRFVSTIFGGILENSLHFRPCLAERGLFYFMDYIEVHMKNSISNLLQKLSSEEQVFVAERILYLRQNILHLTQSEFADALSVTQTYLSQIENKKKSVTSTIIFKICSVYNIRLDWLLSNADDSEIYQSESEIMEYVKSVKQEDAVYSLCSAFNLSKNDMDFLQWYLNISAEERAGFQNAINFLRKMT